MTGTEIGLLAAIVSLVAAGGGGLVTYFLVGRGTVSNALCSERHQTCQAHICSEIDHVNKALANFKKTINKRLDGMEKKLDACVLGFAAFGNPSKGRRGLDKVFKDLHDGGCAALLPEEDNGTSGQE